jgi:WD40 repeat protein
VNSPDYFPISLIEYDKNDNSRLAVAKNLVLCVFNTSGESVQSFRSIGHQQPITALTWVSAPLRTEDDTSMDLEDSAIGSRLITASIDGKLKQWEVRSSAAVESFAFPLEKLTLSRPLYGAAVSFNEIYSVSLSRHSPPRQWLQSCSLPLTDV